MLQYHVKRKWSHYVSWICRLTELIQVAFTWVTRAFMIRLSVGAGSVKWLHHSYFWLLSGLICITRAWDGLRLNGQLSFHKGPSCGLASSTTWRPQGR